MALVGVLSLSGVTSIYANNRVNPNGSNIVIPYMEYINDVTAGLKITTSGEA